jgi:cobalt-zinc-cadmium efflux system membrane fusion protein
MSSLETLFFVIPGLLFVLAGCGLRGSGEAGGHEGHGHAEAGEGGGGNDAHDHDAHEVSDLERSVEDLLADRCEHGIPTWTCDECRYETGIVKVGADLVKEGLLVVETTRLEPVRRAIYLTGEIGFDEQAVGHVRPQVEGTIRSVKVKLGQAVQAGHPLLEQDSREVDEAWAAWQEARSLGELAAGNLRRQEALRKDQITSEREYLAARHEADAADIRTRAAADRLSRLGVRSPTPEGPEDARRTAPRVVIRAPISGTILSMDAVPGEVIRPEDLLLVLGDASRLWVWADLYESDLAPVHAAFEQGRVEARVSVKAWPGESFGGRLDMVGTTLDPASRTVKARILVENPGGRLRPGMFADVQLDLPGGEPVVTGPKHAILEDAGRTFLFRRLDAEHFIRRPVRVGGSWGDRVELPEGVEAGVEIASEGCFLLKSDVLRSKMGAGCAD